MPSHRRRTNRGPDDQQHADESHADPYSRLANDSRQPSNYRRTESTTSNSGRHSYEMSRASSSRTHRDSDWRPKDAENRYGAQRTGYYRRDDYEIPKPRGSGSWPVHGESETRYTDREREWQSYEPEYSTSSYPEPWNAPVEHRSSHHHQHHHQERWQTNDYPAPGHGHVRANSYKERQPERVVEARREWTHDQRRGKDEEKWANGSGWGDRGHTATADHRDSWYHQPHQAHHSPSWSSPPSKKEAMDDRSWEPAESWKSGEQQKYRSQNGSRHDYSTSTKTPATGRRTTNTNHYNHSNYRNYGHANNYSQRDWRNDDGGNLNNWNRRESQTSERAAETTSPPRPRKHRGRSASYSPAESYYSRRSSRGRTKSPSSPASKRRRRDSRSPASHTGQTSSQEPSYAAWDPHPNHTVSSQPSEPYQHNISRRDASPDSSRSTGRSPSRSYSPNPELQHHFTPRIPSSASAPAITSRSEVDAAQTTSDPRRNGTKTNGVHHQRGVRAQPSSQTESNDGMPPPAIIPAAHYPRAADEPLPLPKLPMGPTRIVARPSSFKPIGQNSSSLRRFFPGDDEDMDISSDLSVPESQEPPSQSNAVAALASTEPEPNHPRLPSSPLAPSRASSVVMEEESTEPVPVPVPQQPQTDTGASTPSVQTRSELYALVSQVGEGTFGKVYKAQNTVTKLYVALKRIRMESEKEGFPVTAMREIKLLQSLRHENVVRLYEMMVSNGSVYMVFEYMDHDLTGILSQTQFAFTDSHLKSLCHQMLAGLAYLHHKGVIHRDIKGSNILLNNRGELKLADFGLARFYQKRRRSDYTNRVITLWYRPPELLLGATVYGPEVDMWSAGCIMLELFTKKPVFQGDDEIHQLDTIYRVIGTPTVDRWPDMTTLPWFELVKPKGEPIPNHFREMFRKWMSPAALDLAEWLLCYDPAARATAAQAMVASYFTQEDPPAMAPVGLASIHGEWHELETKRERAKKRRRNDSIQ